MTKEASNRIEELVPMAKLWIELKGELILGRGGALLLRGIVEHGSISKAVQELPQDALGEMESPSYRFAWGYLRKVEDRLGAPIVKKQRGHREGPGGTVLTPLGQQLLDLYEKCEQKLKQILISD